MTSSADTLPDWLRARARAFPHRLALAAGSERLTFGELDRRADRAARQLAGLGVTEGTRVALVLGGCVPFVVLTHALTRLGAVMVPVNTRLAAAEVAWRLRDARAALVICDGRHAGLSAAAHAEAGGAGARVLTVEEMAAAPQAGVSLRERISLAKVQGIIHTSATTGQPKGVLLTYGNHWWNAIGSALHLGLRHDDCWLAPLPLYHIGGLAILWRSVIYGIPVVVHEAFDPDVVNREIDAGQVTIVSVVSTMLHRMLDARGARPYPPTLRCVLLGGGPAPAPLLERCLRLGVPVTPTYGLTEAASQVATLLPEELPRKLGSAGKALFPTEIKIEGGEILVRGPAVMLGYADRPDETARALRGGWLHTGDLGHIDDEGYLYVAERTEDLIVSGGENVYPAEVEAVLLAHPAIEDTGVVGLPDAEWGQVVAAAIRRRAGTCLDDAEVRAFCRERLAGYKVPRRIWFVDDLPRSPSGKLIRRLLREQAPVRRRWVREAFHSISHRYDLLNTLLSGGVHLLWKRAAVGATGLRPGGVGLDVCCGTGDLLLRMARVVGESGRAVGVDFAAGMLEIARRRAQRKRLPRLTLVCAEAEALPARDASCDAVTIAFGLRNVAYSDKALREFHRVLRPGGRLVILEFGRPQSRLVRGLYDFYSQTIIPRLGGWLSGRRDAYQYLHDSIREWPDPETLTAMIREAGFADVRHRLLTGGIAVLHVGERR